MSCSSCVNRKSLRGKSTFQVRLRQFSQLRFLTRASILTTIIHGYGRMKILTYLELQEKSALLPLMEQAFGWTFDPSEFEKTIESDPRLRDGCVGFCAIDNAEILGYVGVLDLNTRLLDGTIEKVGGIYGVATSPGHTRRGVCTELMNRAHEYFEAKDYRFVFLTTSPTIVAFSLYRKLGYSNVTSFPSAYKVKETKSAMNRKKVETPKAYFDKMLEPYSHYAESRTGFVIRDKPYMRMLFKTAEIHPRECLITQEGYAVFKKQRNHIMIRELIAKNQKGMGELVDFCEREARNMVFARAVLDRDLLEVYRSRRFMVLREGHGVLMVKELVEHESFKNAYGDRFFMTSLDHF